MDYTNFNRLDLVDVESHEAACEVNHDAFCERYNLGLALRIVRRMETSAIREAVFAEIKAKNPFYGMVDIVYAKADASILKPLVLFLYMLKCAISVGPFVAPGAKAVAISNFDNERHTIKRLAALVPGKKILQLSLNRGRVTGSDQLRIALLMIRMAPRLWSFLSLLARLHTFMPSARIASGLAYYIRFSRMFEQFPALKTAIIASNYSPEALGLAAAAHNANLKLIYVNHAPVPANGAIVPPVLADCAVFYGEAISHTYERNSRCTAEVALVGQPGTARPMEWRANVQRVGIFLTALTRADTVASLVAAVSTSHPMAQILIRNHPVGLLKSDFSDLLTRHRNLQITIGNPLDDEIAACDLVFCGNSGVAMNVLRGGRPVAYLAALDELSFDYNGFVGRKLVFEAAGWTKDLYFQLQAFYARAAWRAVMQSYDASYGSDKMELERVAAGKILRFLD